MNFGPGVAIPYTGEPPRYVRDPDAEEWHCPTCDVTVPAGIFPFPHQGCSPGTVVDVWTADQAMGRDFDRIDFAWPSRHARYDHWTLHFGSQL